MILAALGLYLDSGLRAQELLQARWSWVNLDQSEIVIPKEFAKNDQARTVPLLPAGAEDPSPAPTQQAHGFHSVAVRDREAFQGSQ